MTTTATATSMTPDAWVTYHLDRALEASSATLTALEQIRTLATEADGHATEGAYEVADAVGTSEERQRYALHTRIEAERIATCAERAEALAEDARDASLAASVAADNAAFVYGWRAVADADTVSGYVYAAARAAARAATTAHDATVAAAALRRAAFASHARARHLALALSLRAAFDGERVKPSLPLSFLAIVPEV